MNLIKLGAVYLNMDLVTDVWVDRGNVNVFFAVPTMYSRVPFRDESNAITTRELRFHGANAAALIQWLEQQATDISPEVDEAMAPDVPGEAHDTERTEYDAVDDSPMS